jgi:hypothetical protein
MLRFFLTEAGPSASVDLGAALRDLYRHLPDEFVVSEQGGRARELAPPGLRAAVLAAGTRLSAMAEAVGRLAAILQKMKVSKDGDLCTHRLSRELDLRSLFGLLCTAVLIG